MSDLMIALCAVLGLLCLGYLSACAGAQRLLTFKEWW